MSRLDAEQRYRGNSCAFVHRAPSISNIRIHSAIRGRRLRYNSGQGWIWPAAADLASFSINWRETSNEKPAIDQLPL